MSSLTSYISSDYQQAADAMRSKSTPKKISVRVECFEDVSFWYAILEPLGKEVGVKFDVIPYSQKGKREDGKDGGEVNKSLITGKSILLKTEVGPFMIACLDSDYDYILSDHSDSAKKVNSNEFIFQTYAYAMENLKCYAESLHSVCVKASNNTSLDIDFFPNLLKEYSSIIYNLFVWNVYFFNVGDKTTFTIDDFKKKVSPPDKWDISSNESQKILEEIKKNVDVKISDLKNKFQDRIVDVESVANKIGERDVTSDNCYLFINGHGLYSNFVLKIIGLVCANLIKEKMEIITNIGMNENLPDKQVSQSKEMYEKSLNHPKTILSTNSNFKDCFLYKKIEKDIQDFLQKHHPKNPTALTTTHS